MIRLLEKAALRPSARAAAQLAMTALSILVLASQAGAQSESTPFLRWRYFYDQRAFPFEKIPRRALQEARKEYERKWPSAGPEFTVAIPGDTWLPIGPTQVASSGGLVPVGRIATIAIHPSDSNTIYIGAAQGGV